MLKESDKLPKFEVQNQDGKPINSQDYLGTKLVIFFYPGANTPTCTVEACNLSDHFSKLSAAGFKILGVSADTVKKQKNFHQKFNFPYDLIADTDHEIIDKFGVWKEKTTFGKTYMGIARTTFIFSETGVCTRVIHEVKSKIAAEQLLENN